MTNTIVRTTLDLRKRPARELHIEPVPGANGCPAPARTFRYAGLTWDATDTLAEGGSAPIGLTLAMEMHGGVS